MTSAATPMPPDVTAAVAALASLSLVFAIKHLLADFVLQTTWMARGKERREGWLLPLLAHVLCHAGLTLAIVLAAAPRLWWLALADLGVHFVVDRIKTALAQARAWRIEQPQFWWLLGFDQFLHQVTNIGLALALVMF